MCASLKRYRRNGLHHSLGSSYIFTAEQMLFKYKAVLLEGRRSWMLDSPKRVFMGPENSLQSVLDGRVQRQVNAPCRMHSI